MPNIEDILSQDEPVKKITSYIDHYFSDDDTLALDKSLPETYRKEYEGERKRRESSLDNIQRDKYIGEDGKERVIVKKYKFPFPKKIVRFATAMLFGGKMIFDTDDQDDKFEDFKWLWRNKMKMQSKLKELCRTVKIETRGAILFYAVKAKPINTKGFNIKSENIIKTKILKSEDGQFAPHFNEFDDMDAFLYSHKEEQTDGSEIDVLDIYTATDRIRFIKDKTDWGEPDILKHSFSVIPVVFAEQEMPDWEDVVSLIDGYEVRVSRLGDANDYTGDPLLILQGHAKLPKKHNVGKVLEFEGEDDDNGKKQYGDAHYLTHDQLPESNKLEMDTLKEGIYNGASTPNLTHEQVKGLGALSGVAIEMLFLDPTLKAIDDLEIFEPVISRCVSVVKNGMASFMNVGGYKGIEDTDISVTFNSPLPTNEKEYIEMLNESVESKTLSRKTATSKHPSVKDGDAEYEQIQQEAKEEANLLNAGSNGETFE